MPNVKIYVEEEMHAGQKAVLSEVLMPLRDIIAKHLNFPQTAFQFAVLPVVTLKDKPAVNVGMQIMPGAERTRDVLIAMGEEIQDVLRDQALSPVVFRCV